MNGLLSWLTTGSWVSTIAGGAVLCAMLSTGCAMHGRSASVVASDESLSEYLAAMRKLGVKEANPRPTPRPPQQTVESWDPALATALAWLATRETPAAHREVARHYARLHLLDSAHAHLTAALRIDKTDAAAYDARARVWRDFGFPAMGLNDAHRAWHYAPGSAEAANTLGTLFEAMGRLKEARAWYSRALEVRPEAWFALNNMCHVETMLGRAEAVAACGKAFEASSSSVVAQNNLALAYAASQDFTQARASFAVSGTAATTAYNMGIVFMATRRFAAAAEEFEAAERADPSLSMTKTRLLQARQHAR